MICKKELELICAEFHLTLVNVEKKLIELGRDGLLLEKKTEIPMPISYDNEPKLQLNRIYFAMASLLLKNVKNILEIGTGTGWSTATFSRLFPDADIYTIDLPEDDPNYKKEYRGESDLRAKTRRENLNKENIISIKKNSFFLSTMDLPNKFDIILVDGDHDYPQVGADIMFAYSHIVEGGFIFMHDYSIVQSNDNVTHAVDWIKQRVPERISLFPQLTFFEAMSIKMALLIKGRFIT